MNDVISFVAEIWEEREMNLIFQTWWWQCYGMGVTADRNIRMNSEVYRSILCSHSAKCYKTSETQTTLNIQPKQLEPFLGQEII